MTEYHGMPTVNDCYCHDSNSRWISNSGRKLPNSTLHDAHLELEPYCTGAIPPCDRLTASIDDDLCQSCYHVVSEHAHKIVAMQDHAQINIPLPISHVILFRGSLRLTPNKTLLAVACKNYLRLAIATVWGFCTMVLHGVGRWSNIRLIRAYSCCS